MLRPGSYWLTRAGHVVRIDRWADGRFPPAALHDDVNTYTVYNVYEVYNLTTEKRETLYEYDAVEILNEMEVLAYASLSD